MSMLLDTDERILDAAQQTLHTLEQDKEVLKQMKAHGFPADGIKVGKTASQKATDARHQKDACYDAQWELGQQVNAQQTAVWALFREHAKLARTAYRNEPGVIHTLRIERFVRGGWPGVRQAAHFYHKMQERNLSLQTLGVSDQEIQQATTDITDLMVLRQMRTRQKAKSESCTQAKNKAVHELRVWVMEVRSTARLAFKKNPQMLEAFGVVVRATV